MKARFRKWLLFFVILAFGSTFGLSWYLHRKEAKENALQLLDVNLTDVAGRVKRAEANLQFTLTMRRSWSARTMYKASYPLVLRFFTRSDENQSFFTVDEVVEWERYCSIRFSK